MEQPVNFGNCGSGIVIKLKFSVYKVVIVWSSLDSRLNVGYMYIYM